MGADCIVMRHDLDDDPHVIRVAEILGEREGLVIDAFRKLWRYVSLHTEDGFLPGAGVRLIDSIAGLDGFARAACEVGWLALQVPGVQVPNFDEYLSVEAIQKFCLDFLKKHPPPLKSMEIHPGFDDFWRHYPRKEAKRDAVKAWNALAPSPELLVAVLTSLASFNGSESWRKDDGKYIPYPATWLRRRPWEEEHGPGKGLGSAGRVRSGKARYAGLSTQINSVQEAPPAASTPGGLFPPQGP